MRKHLTSHQAPGWPARAGCTAERSAFAQDRRPFDQVLTERGATFTRHRLPHLSGARRPRTARRRGDRRRPDGRVALRDREPDQQRHCTGARSRLCVRRRAPGFAPITLSHDWPRCGVPLHTERGSDSSSRRPPAICALGAAQRTALVPVPPVGQVDDACRHDSSHQL